MQVSAPDRKPAPGRLWAIMMWSRTSTANISSTPTHTYTIRWNRSAPGLPKNLGQCLGKADPGNSCHFLRRARPDMRIGGERHSARVEPPAYGSNARDAPGPRHRPATLRRVKPLTMEGAPQAAMVTGCVAVPTQFDDFSASNPASESAQGRVPRTAAGSVEHQVAVPGRSASRPGQRSHIQASWRDRRARMGLRIYQSDLRRPAGIRAQSHATRQPIVAAANDRDPIADPRRGVPIRVERGFDLTRQAQRGELVHHPARRSAAAVSGSKKRALMRDRDKILARP